MYSLVFELSKDKQKAKCKICAPYIHVEEKCWILRRSISIHIKSPNHLANSLRNVSSYEKRLEEAVQNAEIEDNEQDSEYMNLQGQALLQSLPGRADAKSNMSEAERRLWTEYEVGESCTFEIAEETCAIESREARRRYERDVEDFGLWNDEFDIGAREMDEDREEEEIMAEAMRNACKLQILQSRATTLALANHSALT